MSDTTHRWRAEITYRTEDGERDEAYGIAELRDLHELIEQGPHWDTVTEIVLRQINPVHPGLTVEQAATL